ncbi:MAG TPA: M23 family metallopeptidase [Gemmatimonadales bacterium]|jgi:murein DD-endopeptidase MepM/ murein hydrolase activator NlpD|nr:M23 family metallopeptidase [Gemmatimonadales bacterium]
MSKRHWTIVVVPQGSSATKIIELSHTALKLIGSLAVATSLLILLLGYATVRRSLNLARADRLERENSLLAADLDQLHGRLSTLTETIAGLEQQDNKLRLLANLDPIDPQVYAAGIGGPRPADATTIESSELLGRAGAVRVDLNALIRRAHLLTSSFREAGDSLALHSERLAATPSIMPTTGWLSSAFSRMRVHPILHEARPHEGIDVTAPMGAPIEAPANGSVVQTGWEPGYGNVVVIDHGYGVTTKFAHASRILVRVGDKVRRGELIAQVGNTGLSTGPHLHYEVHVNGRPVDPRRYILSGVVTD